MKLSKELKEARDAACIAACDAAYDAVSDAAWTANYAAWSAASVDKKELEVQIDLIVSFLNLENK